MKQEAGNNVDAKHHFKAGDSRFGGCDRIRLWRRWRRHTDDGQRWRPDDGRGTPPTYGIPSDVAEIAAKATPARGSVTQSSNAIGGVTQDRASVVHEADGTLTLRVSRGNARTWDISTGDDVNLIESDNSPNAILDASIREFVIERELWGGATEYVGMITTKRANDALHPGTREFHVGDTIDV